MSWRPTRPAPAARSGASAPRTEPRRLRSACEHGRARPASSASPSSARARRRFNASEAGAHRRRPDAARLGEPQVSVGAAAGSPSEVRVTVAWELTWYQWGVDLGDELRAGLPARQGPRDRPARRRRRGSGTPRRRGRTDRLGAARGAATASRPAEPCKLTVNVDGGARGNPGPAAIGVVVRDADGEVLEERGERIGRATNNVAEYRALLRGIELAAAQRRRASWSWSATRS